MGVWTPMFAVLRVQDGPGTYMVFIPIHRGGTVKKGTISLQGLTFIFIIACEQEVHNRLYSPLCNSRWDTGVLLNSDHFVYTTCNPLFHVNYFP